MQFEEIKVAGLRNHPKQFLFSDISGSEYKEFVASVRDEGLKQPLIISERTGHKVIIDGHQRLRAALEVGLKTLPAIIQPFADEREEVGVMIAANLKRRQLSRRDKAKVIEEYIKLFPERSDRWLADDLGIDEKTVGSKRGELETTAEIPQLDKTTGKDGKERPRKQKAAELVGTSREQLRKIDAVEASGLEPVKEAWGKSKISTHAAHVAVKAPDPIQDAISSGAVSVDDGIAVAKDKVLKKEVAEGRKTVQEAASVAKQMKEARQAKKQELDYDVYHAVLDALEAITNLELSEYHRAAHSGEGARYNVNAIEIGIEDAITHLQKAAEAIRIVETPDERKTISANLN